MKIEKIETGLSVSGQIFPQDIPGLAAAGFKTILCHRPDGEGADQPTFHELQEQARLAGIEMAYLPVESGKVSDADVQAFAQSYAGMAKPVLAYCRSGMRAVTLWALSQVAAQGLPAVLSTAKAAGYDLSGLTYRLAGGGEAPAHISRHQVVIVGAGAAGIAAASSLLSRNPDLDIAVIDPAEIHYYQPGWTMVGGGVFRPEVTVRTMASVIPAPVKWIKAAVAAFEPNQNRILLEGCKPLAYDVLVVCPGIKLDWHGIEGLVETLGENGVTSNYRYDLAPYTWQLVSQLRRGKAVFTQPPMPIKCAGAPQKAMYLSADYWRRTGCLRDISVDFYNSGPVLFGVKEYVPALMEYVERYDARLHFGHRLTKVDGKARRAWFAMAGPEGGQRSLEVEFDMLHVVPPQQAPDFIRASSLTDSAGWLDVDQYTLRHKQYANVFALGDVTNAPNAKTAAAARKQAPVVAENVLAILAGQEMQAIYDGYGSCPLTVERGKIVLAEFGYGGKLLPSFPRWLINGQRPSRLAWWLKERILPPVYWKAMLKGREWLASPATRNKEAG
ncbi:TIGR01244 family sulfur transferase [Methylobacillus sp. Pita1]|uniref:TIGR01244 family sulfur transferase n=1 Tax=Methylobacillus sp. Pita1 TaxID=3382642 RepID=UPI0038B657C2